MHFQLFQYQDEEMDENEARPRAKKASRKRQTKKSIFDVSPDICHVCYFVKNKLCIIADSVGDNGPITHYLHCQ